MLFDDLGWSGVVLGIFVILLLILCFIMVFQSLYTEYPPDWIERNTSEYLEYITLSSSDKKVFFRLKNVSEQQIAVHGYDQVISDGNTVIGSVFAEDFDGILSPEEYVSVKLVFPSSISDSAEFQFTVTNMRGEVLGTLKGEI